MADSCPSRWTCPDVEKHLTDYFEGVLSSPDRVGFRLHVQRCGACSESLERMRFALRTVRGLTEPSGRPDQVSEAIREYRAWRQRQGREDLED